MRPDHLNFVHQVNTTTAGAVSCKLHLRYSALKMFSRVKNDVNSQTPTVPLMSVKIHACNKISRQALMRVVKMNPAPRLRALPLFPFSWIRPDSLLSPTAALRITMKLSAYRSPLDVYGGFDANFSGPASCAGPLRKKERRGKKQKHLQPEVTLVVSCRTFSYTERLAL